MKISTVAAAALLAGCGITYRYRSTTSVAAAPKPPTCQFDVLSMPPDKPYDQIGILKAGDPAAADPEVFADVVRAKVCEAGGDAVVAKVNGLGVYIEGSVIRYRAQ